MALEATTITHGREEAEKARETSRNLFYGQGLGYGVGPDFTIWTREKLEKGIWRPIMLLVEAGLCQTRGEARGLIAQGGVSFNDQRIPSFDLQVEAQRLEGQYPSVDNWEKKVSSLKIIFLDFFLDIILLYR